MCYSRKHIFLESRITNDVDDLVLADAGLVYLEDLLLQVLQHPPLPTPPRLSRHCRGHITVQ